MTIVMTAFHGIAVGSAVIVSPQINDVLLQAASASSLPIKELIYNSQHNELSHTRAYLSLLLQLRHLQLTSHLQQLRVL